jgi:hypothetical protein
MFNARRRHAPLPLLGCSDAGSGGMVAQQNRQPMASLCLPWAAERGVGRARALKKPGAARSIASSFWHARRKKVSDNGKSGEGYAQTSAQHDQIQGINEHQKIRFNH